MVDRLSILLLTLCVGFAVLIFFELSSTGNNTPEVEAAAPNPQRAATNPTSPRRQQQRAKDLLATALAHPLFSPTRRPPEAAASQTSIDPGLEDVRLTGIVVDANRRLAIFAVAGEKPRALSEGEALNGWRLNSILPEQVSLTGPGGATTLEPKPDTKLVRRAPVPVPPTQPQAAAPPPQAAAAAVPANMGVPRQPVAAQPQLPPRTPLPGALKPPPPRRAHDG
jgi:hypothetical protein